MNELDQTSAFSFQLIVTENRDFYWNWCGNHKSISFCRSKTFFLSQEFAETVFVELPKCQASYLMKALLIESIMILVFSTHCDIIDKSNKQRAWKCARVTRKCHVQYHIWVLARHIKKIERKGRKIKLPHFHLPSGQYYVAWTVLQSWSLRGGKDSER